MKKLTMCAVAATVVLSCQANAAPGNVQLVGAVLPVCEVTGMNSQLLDFGLVDVAHKTVSANIKMKCNDSDGATVTLTSAEGGLESDDKEDHALAYDAKFSVGSLPVLILDAPGGIGTNNYAKSETYSGSTALAGGINGHLTVETQDSSPWAGGYSDTLTLDITSN